MTGYNKMKKITIELPKIELLLLYLTFFVLMIYIYKDYIVPVYRSFGNFKWDFNIYNAIFSAVSIVVIVLLLPSKFSRPTDILLHIQFIFQMPCVDLWNAKC